jgi:hypothetical protein
VNEKHLELCSSAEWADAVERWIIPWVLDDVSLGDEVLEIGPGPGRTTEILAGLVPRLTAVEVDAELARSLSAAGCPCGRDYPTSVDSHTPGPLERHHCVGSAISLSTGRLPLKATVNCRSRSRSLHWDGRGGPA